MVFRLSHLFPTEDGLLVAGQKPQKPQKPLEYPHRSSTRH